MQNLNDAFLQKLFEAGAELFVFRCIWIVEKGKRLRGESRDFVVDDFGVGRECVANAEIGIANEADDVAGVGVVHRFAFLGEEFVGIGEAHFFSGAGVDDGHVAFEFAGADAQEGDAVAVARVHVGLDFEDESGEGRVFGTDFAGAAVAGFWRGAVF